MKEFFRVLRTVWVLAFALLIVLPTIASAQGEIPLTTKSDEARKIFLQARQLFDNVRFDEAREFFSKAVEKDPDFALAHLYRAFTNTSDMDFQSHLQKAVALAPKVSEGERLMIESTQADAENNPVKALQLLEQLAQKYPNDKYAHQNLAFAYSGRDENDKAIAELERAVAIDKNFASAYNSLGYAYTGKVITRKARRLSETTFASFLAKPILMIPLPTCIPKWADTKTPSKTIRKRWN